MSKTLALDSSFCNLLIDSYFKMTGEYFLSQEILDDDAARWLYEDAPFCVVAHNTNADPTFMYANQTAQRCFEYNWDEITSLHSRLTAEYPNQKERQQLLESVQSHGVVTGYQGLRISKSGKRFWIKDVTIWNLMDHYGEYKGQAAIYNQWNAAHRLDQ